MMEPIRICQWNARSIRTKKEEVGRLIALQKIDVLTVSETWLKPRHKFSIPHYKIFRSDRTTEGGGVLIAIKNSIQISNVSYVTNFTEEFQAIQLDFRDFILISLYNSPGHPITRTFWTTHFPIHDGKKYIILGDFNLGISPDNIDRGNHTSQFLHYLHQHNTTLLNSMQATRLGQRNQISTSPDLTFISTVLRPITEWRVDTDTYGSDHYPIYTFLRQTDCALQHSYVYVRARSIDWDNYKSVLLSSSHNIHISGNVQSDLDMITNSMIGYLDFYHPLHKLRPRLKIKPAWWSSDIQQAIAKRKRAILDFSRHMTLRHYLQAKAHIAAVKRLIRTTKRDSWRSLCSTFTSDLPTSVLWQKLKWFTGKRDFSPTRISYDQPLQYAFLKFIAPDSAIQNSLSFSPDHAPGPANLMHPLLQEVTYSELRGIISQYKKRTAGGPDGITYDMVQHLPEPILLRLTAIYSSCLRTASIHSSWSDYFVVPILKPGKTGIVAEDYRPILLGNVFKKLLEKIMVQRLSHFLERFSLWPSGQYGFRKGYNPVFNLMQLTNDIYTSWLNRSYLVATSIDLQRAYDSVNLHTLISILQSLTLPDIWISLIYQLMSQRRLQLHPRHHNSMIRITSHGLPQGSSLSPILFALYIGSVNTSQLWYSQVLTYADDILIYGRIQQINGLLVNRLQEDIDRIVQILTDLGLTINANKTQTIVFTRGRPIRRHLFTIHTQQILTQPVLHLLGISLNHNLNWDAYYHQLYQYIYTRMNIFKYTAGRDWGMHPSTMLLLFNTLIQAKIDYGISISGPPSKKWNNKLRSLTYQIGKTILGVSGKPLQQHVFDLLKMESLHSRKIRLTNTKIGRVWYNLSSPIYNKLKFSLEQWTKSGPLKGMDRPAFQASFQSFQDSQYSTISSSTCLLSGLSYSHLPNRFRSYNLCQTRCQHTTQFQEFHRNPRDVLYEPTATSAPYFHGWV